MTDFDDPLLQAARQAVGRDKTVLQAVINAVPTPIFFKDDRGHYLGCNRAFEEYIGMTREELVGKTVFELFDPDLARVYAAADESLFQRGGDQVYEAQVKYADGNLRDVMFHKAVFNAEDDGLSGLVGVILDITDRKKMESQYRKLALTDTVTQLANRFSLMRSLQEAVDRMQRTGNPLALMLVDLDDFKSVNDTLGHVNGDAVLVEVANRLRTSMRKTDTIARLGGDEFAVLIQDMPSSVAVSQLAEKLLGTNAAPIEVDSHSIELGLSVGIALAPDHADCIDTLMRHADLALYRAKSRGKNCFHIYSHELSGLPHCPSST